MNKANIDKTAEDIVKYITEKIKDKHNLIIAIEGRCAAGKTTLAAILQEKTGAYVFHMDDFFLRPEQRTQERLLQPGGNVDYERFEDEVLKPLQSKQFFSYAPFDCKSMRLQEKIHVAPQKIVIVEGAYSCHPRLEKYYDIKIFLSVEPKEQEKRILQRNGKEKLNVFREKWIPLEELYFEKCKTKERCELSFGT